MPIKHPRLGALANEFTSTFAVFEYALKECGYRELIGKKHPKLQTSWNEFAKVYPAVAGKQFFQKLKVGAGTAYLIAHPPKHRTEVSAGHGRKRLDWRKADEVASMSDLYFAVKRVRNNLFHGDKSEWNDTRDERLLRSALAVIDALIEQAPDVKRAFENGTDLFANQRDL